MITTTHTAAGAVYGARLRVDSGAPASAWKQQRPELGGFKMINNSTGVSARERRHR